MRLRSADEIVREMYALATERSRDLIQGDVWWLDPATYTLVHRETGYYVPLEDCTTAGCVLGWIQHVGRKPWADARCIGELALALDRILPLAYSEAAITPAEVRRRVDEVRDR
jgi:hypothetical protein